MYINVLDEYDSNAIFTAPLCTRQVKTSLIFGQECINLCPNIDTKYGKELRAWHINYGLDFMITKWDMLISQAELP